MKAEVVDVAELEVHADHLRPATLTRLVVFKRDQGYVAVLTELDENPSMSITNAAEHVWTAVQRRLASRAILSHLAVEHYPPRGVIRDATYDEVSFAGVDYKGVCRSPRWQYIGPERFESMIGYTLEHLATWRPQTIAVKDRVSYAFREQLHAVEADERRDARAHPYTAHERRSRPTAPQADRAHPPEPRV